jgi:hypothetical protein
MDEEIRNINEIRPDVIIDFIENDSILPVSVIYVRPESNEIHYEKAIILGINPFGDVIYLANLNGRLFIRDALILEHYASQYKFAIYGKEEIEKYHEMVIEFENYFNTDFDCAKIIGSFDAILKLNISDEELFNFMVEKKDFFKFYGQTIKKIKDFYVVNYDMPAILKRYTPSTNVFALSIRLKNENIDFSDINQSIFDQLTQDNTPIISGNELILLDWNEKIKRTYHISRNHIMAMFDMLDFIIKTNNTHIDCYDTPLGKILIDQYGYTSGDLLKIKQNPLVYINDNGRKKLINIVEEADKKSLYECADLISRINWDETTV